MRIQKNQHPANFLESRLYFQVVDHALHAAGLPLFESIQDRQNKSTHSTGKILLYPLCCSSWQAYAADPAHQVSERFQTRFSWHCTASRWRCSQSPRTINPRRNPVRLIDR